MSPGRPLDTSLFPWEVWLHNWLDAAMDHSLQDLEGSQSGTMDQQDSGSSARLVWLWKGDGISTAPDLQELAE